MDDQLIIKKQVDWQYNSEGDFIKSLEIFNNKCAVTTEKGIITLIEYNDCQLISQLQIKCANPIYDVQISEDSILSVSQREYPINLYKYTDEGDIMNVGRINDIKPNSEKFLTPLKMKFRQQELIGCGKEFLHIYDLNKMKLSKEFKCIKNKEIYASAFDVPSSTGINKNQTFHMGAVGLFNKDILIVDLMEDKILTKLKIHLGGITQIKFSQDNSLILYSSARKDNLIYQWDLRNTSRFVRYFERKNNTNQRTLFDIKGNTLAFGNDVIFYNTTPIFINKKQKDGTAFLYQDNNKYQFQVNDSGQCVNSIQLTADLKHCIASYGERAFNFNSESMLNKSKSGIVVYKL